MFQQPPTILRLARRERFLTLDVAAQAGGTHISTLSRAERGFVALPDAVLERLAALYEIPVNRLKTAPVQQPPPRGRKPASTRSSR